MSRLFSSPRAFAPGDDEADKFIALDQTDFGADRFFDKRNGNPASAEERDDTNPKHPRHRATQELRRKRFDFSQLLKHWRT